MEENIIGERQEAYLAFQTEIWTSDGILLRDLAATHGRFALQNSSYVLRGISIWIDTLISA